MNKKIIILIVILVIAALGYFIFMDKPKDNTAPASQANWTGPTAKPSVNGPSGSPQGSMETTQPVTIKGYSFIPSSTSIKQGGKIVWTNDDPVAHIVRSDLFESGILNQGDKFEFTFDQKGTYNYSCKIHPTMKGTIIVN